MSNFNGSGLSFGKDIEIFEVSSVLLKNVNIQNSNELHFLYVKNVVLFLFLIRS